MAENRDAYKIKLFQDETARCVRRLYREGHLPNESLGSVSTRDAESGNVFISIKPGTFYVGDPGNYHGSDIAVVDANGRPLRDTTPPSDMLALHLAIYRARPDVTAIIHSHPVWCSLFAQRKEALPYVLAEQMEASTAVGCVGMAPSMTQAYFDEVVRVLADQKFVMLYNFGTISVGDNVDNAINYLAWMESVAEKITLASMIGELNHIE